MTRYKVRYEVISKGEVEFEAVSRIDAQRTVEVAMSPKKLLDDAKSHKVRVTAIEIIPKKVN